MITSFAVSTAIALPLTGWLSRRFGERKLFVWATLAFVITSLLCGLAQSMGMLVLSRALQGFVAGPMYPITQSLLVSIYPREKRGQALALLAMITVVAPICGPILGGWITDNYSWEWIFLINVPLGIFAALVVGNQLKGRPEQIEKPKMDYVGLVTLVIGVGALQLVLDLGNDEDWFSSMKIVVLACVAVVTLTVFLIWELTDKDPIVDLKLFRHRNFRAGTLAMVVAYAAFFSVALLIPQWLQRDMGYTAIWAGLATAPIGILPVIMTPFVGKYASRFDMRMLATIAFIVLSMTSFLRSNFNPGGLHARGRRAADHGHRRGTVLHAGAADPAVGPGRTRDRRGLGPGHVPAYAGRQLRGLADDVAVGAAYPGAPCRPDRTHLGLSARYAGPGHRDGAGRPAARCGGTEQHDQPPGVADGLQ